jgi:hypothetical protein
MTEQAERPSERLKVSVEVWISVAQSGPRMNRRHGSAEGWIHQFGSVATLFACGAGDGNRTRTVSLGRVLIPSCFRVLQRYWRPQLASGDPLRPGLVARVWPGSLGSRAEPTRAMAGAPRLGARRPGDHAQLRRHRSRRSLRTASLGMRPCADHKGLRQSLEDRNGVAFIRPRCGCRGPRGGGWWGLACGGHAQPGEGRARSVPLRGCP